jgi:hypothetical protein
MNGFSCLNIFEQFIIADNVSNVAASCAGKTVVNIFTNVSKHPVKRHKLDTALFHIEVFPKPLE